MPGIDERPLRICFVAYRGNMACGGQGVYLWFLAREMARMGHDVSVFVGPPYPDAMPWAEVERLPNREFWAKWFTNDVIGMIPPEGPLGLLRPLTFYELASSWLGFLPEPFAFSVRAFSSVAHALREGRRFDLVHDVQCLGYGLLGLRALGLPLVTTVHHPLTVDRRTSFRRDTNFSEALGTQQFYPIGMQRFVAKRMDRVLTSSEQSGRQIALDFHVSPQRIRNVLNGLDTDLYSPDERVAKREGEVLCVGRASDPNKGIRGLIEAFAKVDAPARLTLVDNDHPGNAVFKWARDAGVADRIDVTGRLSTERLVELYRRASVCVVPSRHEGFGLPAVEAMACGTPVVATRAGALPEVMSLTGGGLDVPVDDPGALAGGIQRLLDDAELRSALAKRGRTQVVEHLAWSKVAATTAGVYREILREREAARRRVWRGPAIYTT